MSGHGYNTRKRRESNQSSNGDGLEGSNSINSGRSNSSSSSRRSSNESHASSKSNTSSSVGSSHSYNTRRSSSSNGSRVESKRESNGKARNKNVKDGRQDAKKQAKARKQSEKSTSNGATNGDGKASNGRKTRNSNSSSGKDKTSTKNGDNATQDRDVFGRPNRSATRSSLSEKRERAESHRREQSRRRSEQVSALWSKAEAALRSPARKDGDFSPLLGNGEYFKGAGGGAKQPAVKGDQNAASQSLEEVIALAAESEGILVHAVEDRSVTVRQEWPLDKEGEGAVSRAGRKRRRRTMD